MFSGFKVYMDYSNFGTILSGIVLVSNYSGTRKGTFVIAFIIFILTDSGIRSIA